MRKCERCEEKIISWVNKDKTERFHYDVTANDGYYGEPHKMTLFQVGGVLMIQQVFKKPSS